MARAGGGGFVRIAAGLLLMLAAWLAPGARARAQAGGVCPRVPAGLRCAALPREGWGRREALQTLDADGRRRVSRGDLAGAAQAFGCLVADDPTPEAAGNLAVVLREQGNLGDALLAARCAEDLAPSGPARDRARTRREEIEHRLGMPPSAPAGAAGERAGTAGAPVDLAALMLRPRSAPGAPDLRAPSPSPSPSSSLGSFRRGGYTTLAVGGAALIAAGVLYALARDRAHQFDDEQQRNGYSDRARGLRSDAQTLETATWINAAVGVVAAAVGGVLLTF
jgi:hypothetical protein